MPSALVKTYHSTGSVQRTAELFVKDVLLAETFPSWAFASPIALCSLFLGSTSVHRLPGPPGRAHTDTTCPAPICRRLLTEWLTSDKYPLYSSEYKRRVGMFLPIDTYLKRIWLSITVGNEKRKAGERRLGWGNRKKLD